ncbi:MAG: hypothetical protein Q8P68_02340 [Candidatus Peregrinibacteria bacterium]|nr:hypothetical protein [Candidatus Peregrinibacteria bacterium]
MRFLSSTLTISMKFMFFIIFTLGIFILSILNTYLDRDYYENHFANEFIKIQSEHIEGIIEDKSGLMPSALSKENIRMIFEETFTKENILNTANTVFDSIENYDGKMIVIDLTFLKEKENDFINKLVEETTPTVSMQKEAKTYLRKNINFGIPPTIEIETENSVVDNIVKTLQFILLRKFTVNMIIISLMLSPLTGIFALNLHPLYIGVRKVSSSLAVAGFLTSSVEVLSRFIVKSLYTSETVRNAFDSSGVTFSEEKVSSIFDFAFGDILHLITLAGIITLVVGIMMYVISKILQKRYEHSY